MLRVARKWSSFMVAKYWFHQEFLRTKAGGGCVSVDMPGLVIYRTPDGEAPYNLTGPRRETHQYGDSPCQAGFGWDWRQEVMQGPAGHAKTWELDICCTFPSLYNVVPPTTSRLSPEPRLIPPSLRHLPPPPRKHFSNCILPKPKHQPPRRQRLAMAFRHAPQHVVVGSRSRRICWRSHYDNPERAGISGAATSYWHQCLEFKALL